MERVYPRLKRWEERAGKRGYLISNIFAVFSRGKNGTGSTQKWSLFEDKDISGCVPFRA